jgi:ketosteroid isomerase-like protein
MRRASRIHHARTGKVTFRFGMNRTFLLGGAISVLFLTSTWSEATSPDAGAITAAVNGFHDALRRGDAKAAMELLAPDAVILESGAAQTREQYEKHHLVEDIEFSRAVTMTSSILAVRIEGNAAWVSSTNRATGSFGGRQVNSAGAELIVLTNSVGGWRIRAIHWSSHAVKKAD